jgi:hypothetical protein
MDPMERSMPPATSTTVRPMASNPHSATSSMASGAFAVPTSVVAITTKHSNSASTNGTAPSIQRFSNRSETVR